MTIRSKYCQCCARELPLTQFGHGAPICIHCETLPQREVSRLTRETVEREQATLRHRSALRKDDRIKIYLARYAIEGKRCSACHVHKPASEFGPCNPRPDGLQGSCKACNRLRATLISQPKGLLLWKTVREQMRAQTAAQNEPSNG